MHHTQFPSNVLEQAAIAGRIRTSSYLAKRSDLRGKIVFSFSENNNSPAEYAFSLYPNGRGWKLGVHVADVAEYACEGSPMDKEARARIAAFNDGSSVEEMLPENIRYDLCNLATSGDKLALSVFMDIDSKGNVIDVTFEESVIQISANCIYGEIDQLGLTTDTSSVMSLRNKYAPILDTVIDMYEIAATYCANRRDRGGLDCTNFKRVYESDKTGKIISFNRVPESDSRAMIREIGYLTAEAVGRFMCEHNIPAIFNGRNPVDQNILNLLVNLLGINTNETDPAKITDLIAEEAKGKDYYDFVCDVLKNSVPRPVYSAAPIYNSLCASDKIVSFFTPASNYTNLLVLQVLKTVAKAKGDPSNLNLNRFHKTIREVCDLSNKLAVNFEKTINLYAKLNALKYIKDSKETQFKGIAVKRIDSGEIIVALECGARVLIPLEYAQNYNLDGCKQEFFSVITLGDENAPTYVKPI